MNSEELEITHINGYSYVSYNIEKIQMWKNKIDTELSKEITTPIQTTDNASNDPNFKGHQVIE